MKTTGGLSQDDYAEFQRLRNMFHSDGKNNKETRAMQLYHEFATILQFIERSPTGRERRCVAAGLGFACAFICISTRSLQDFLGRSKSSINQSLQQLGYVSLKTRPKARTVVLSALPSLISDPVGLRQWSVRYASPEAMFCFITPFVPRSLPQLTSDDFSEVIDLTIPLTPSQVPVEAIPPLIHSEFDIQSIAPVEMDREVPDTEGVPEWTPLVGHHDEHLEVFSFL